MKKFDKIRDEGYSSMAQQRAVWATRKDGGKGHPDNKKKSRKEDVNPKVGLKVMKKGKEVEPTPPKIGVVSYTRGKKDVNEISKGMAGRYLKKVPASAAGAGRKATGSMGIGPDDQKKNMKKGIKQFVNRNKGTSMAVDKMTGKAKVPATESVEEKTAHVFDNEKDARAKAKEIGGKYVRGKGVSAGKHAAVKEDSDAVKAFLAKGGKIKKLPPAKAQGYHGKDDPGKDIHGVMDKPDTKSMGTRKKVKSMESKSFFDLRNELSK